tara:strand:- start:480 stop:605 length:126 start_codon:yes stop_codon:yes gene_type:complete
MITVYELNGRQINKQFADEAALKAWIATLSVVSSLSFTKGE